MAKQPRLLPTIIFSGFVVAFWRIGASELPLPEPSAVPGWWVDVGPAVALLTLARAIALVCAGSILVLAVLHLLASSSEIAAGLARRATPRLAFPALVGLGVATSACAAAPDPGWVPVDPNSATATASLRLLAAAPTTAVSPSMSPQTTQDREPASVATDPRQRFADDEARTRITATPTTATSVTGGATAADPVWTIEAGDHLWAVAQHTVENHLGRVGTAADVDRYWRRLVDANRDRLVDPSNADLVFPGQLILLPPVG